MSSSEMIILILTIVVFMATTVNYNHIMLSKSQNLWATIENSNGLALGQYLLDVVWTKAYDEKTVNNIPSSIPNAFTKPRSLGAENGEHFPFDDIDDFNGWKTEFDFANTRYKVKSRVYYSNKQGDSLSSKSEQKMVIFEIENPIDGTSVKTEKIFSFISGTN